MKLSESHSSLSSLCRAVEIRLRFVDALAGLNLPIVMLPDFESLPESKDSATVRDTPFAYQRREKRIIVNGDLFPSLASDVCEAALAHEIAHALYHRSPIVIKDPQFSIALDEEIVADLLVCRWGFLDELNKERFQSYGAKYCNILKLWRQEDVFAREMTIWHQQHLAGIL
jgi:hypothetical protein